MQFIYEIVSFQELDKVDKILLTLQGKDFYFARRYNGPVKINKELPRIQEVIKIAKSMWQFDKFLDGDDVDLMDNLWQQMKLIAGENAADQLYKAWCDALDEKLEQEAKAAAKEWTDTHCIVEELDAITVTLGTYNPRFIKALWSQTTNTDAIFLYGYQTGMEAARKAAMA